jgi:hypothetical protein
MRRWLATITIAVLCVGRVTADVTITMATSVEGPMTALAGGGNMSPKIVTQIKGAKSRTEVDLGDQNVATLIDLATKQAIMLRRADKTATVLDGAVPGAAKPPIPLPKADIMVKPTGKKREIDTHQCDEFTVAMSMDMASMAGGDMPPAAAAMLKDVRMAVTGFLWVAKGAPGSAEYQAFQTNASKLAISVLSGVSRGMPSGIEQMLTGFKDAPGIPYLTELTMNVEGSGEMVEMMKKMGQMKIITRVTSISTDSLPDTLFVVPEDYKLVK